MRIFLVYLSVSAVFFVTARGTFGASDRETLGYIANKIDSNYGGIYSWMGSAVGQVTFRRTKPSPIFADERYTKHEYNYAFDKSKGNFVSLALLQDEYSIYKGVKKHVLVESRSFLCKGGTYYSFEWFDDRDVETFAVKDDNLSPVKSYEISRIVHIHKEPFKVHEQPYRESLFNPFEKFTSDKSPEAFNARTYVVREIQTILKGMKIRKYDNFAEAISRAGSPPGNIAELVTEGNKIMIELRNVDQQGNSGHSKATFDINQGYNLIASYYQSETKGKFDHKRQWKCNYTKVSGFWVPQRTEIETQWQDGSSMKEIVDWTSYQLNEPIPDSKFTLQNMRVCRGDKLYDERTKTTTIISGDDFPPVSHKINIENIRFPYARYILIISGIALIVISAFWEYRRQKTNRKR
jgi:hypothetical protein